jgi:DNA-binding MarR family transcriptional regulator
MATKVIDRLERDDLLERHLGAVPDDRRAVTVQISEPGRHAITACEDVLAELGIDLLAAIAAVDFGDPDRAPAVDETELPGSLPPGTGPALAEFLRFVVEIDKPLLATAGGIDALHARDPRGLLLLSELDRHGPRRAGAVPALIDRSRSAAHRLCRDLEAVGLVARAASAEDQREVSIEITEVGRAVLRGVVAAITAHLPQLRPSMVALSRTLTGQRQGLGAPPRS